jgi:hypothetical protein
MLGWTPQERLDIRVHGASLVLQRDPRGVFTLTRRGLISIPPVVRRWWSFGTGDPVLLVAVPERAAVVIHSLAVLDKVLPDPRRVVVASRAFDSGNDEGRVTDAPGSRAADADVDDGSDGAVVEGVS